MHDKNKVFYGWFVVGACLLVSFGVVGSQFSFGVFLKPMTDEFAWSRGTLSLAFGTTFMLSGLLRPAAGYLADRYNPKFVALSGVGLMGCMLLLTPLVSNLAHLYLVFSVMALGITLGSGSALTKIVSSWFHRNRGVTLGLVTGGGSVGAIILVPASSSFLVWFDWERAYIFLGLVLLLLVLPVGILVLKNRPQDMGLRPLTESGGPKRNPERLAIRDSTFGEALRTGLFWRLTFGYFI